MWHYDLGSRRLRSAEGWPADVPLGELRCGIESEPLPWSGVREQLREWNVPGVSRNERENTILIIYAPGERVERRVAAGTLPPAPLPMLTGWRPDVAPDRRSALIEYSTW